MRTITVTLPDEIADEVERMAADGDWADLNEYLMENCCTVVDGKLKPLTHDELKREIQRGIDDCEQGRLLDGEELMDRWIAELDERVK